MENLKFRAWDIANKEMLKVDIMLTCEDIEVIGNIYENPELLK